MSRLVRCNHCMALYGECGSDHILKCRKCGKYDALIEAPLIDATPVAPPVKPYTRAMPWRVFERRFLPVAKPDGSNVWEKWEIPKDADYREWWTVVDPMTSSGRWYLGGGVSFREPRRVRALRRAMGRGMGGASGVCVLKARERLDVYE